MVAGVRLPGLSQTVRLRETPGPARWPCCGPIAADVGGRRTAARPDRPTISAPTIRAGCSPGLREGSGVEAASRVSVGCGRSRRLIGGEDRAERAERLLRHGLHRELQYATDDRRDVAHGVALVGHGVPCGPGRRLLQDQPEEYGCVERMHGRPALGAVAGVAGH